MEANSSRPEEGEISTSNSDIDVSGSFRLPIKPGRLYKKRKERKRLKQRSCAPGVHVQCNCNARKQLEYLQSKIKLHNVETIASEIVKVTSTTLKKYQNIIETLKLALDIGMGRDRFLPRREGTRHFIRDETNFETEFETEEMHSETIRDFGFSTMP